MSIDAKIFYAQWEVVDRAGSSGLNVESRHTRSSFFFYKNGSLRK